METIIPGDRFGRWTVTGNAGRDKQSHILLACVCDCGEHKAIRIDKLLTGQSKSCGCLQRELLGKRRTLHGGTVGSRERLYIIWRGMKDRCGNPKCLRFSDYGGRGIRICPEWIADYPAFRAWALTNGYADDLTIDRIDNDKGYAPSNCRWATRSDQQKNTRKRRPRSCDLQERQTSPKD